MFVQEFVYQWLFKLNFFSFSLPSHQLVSTSPPYLHQWYPSITLSSKVGTIKFCDETPTGIGLLWQTDS